MFLDEKKDAILALDEKATTVGILSMGVSQRLNLLCELLVKKGVLTEDDIKQINSTTEKEITTLFGGIHHG